MLLYICSVSEAQVHVVFLVKYLSCSRPSVNVLSSHQNAAAPPPKKKKLHRKLT